MSEKYRNRRNLVGFFMYWYLIDVIKKLVDRCLSCAKIVS